MSNFSGLPFEQETITILLFSASSEESVVIVFLHTLSKWK